MKKPLGIIFDLGDTVLEYEKNTPEKATQKLLEISCNPNNISVDTIQQFVKILLRETFLKRDSAQIEVNFQSFQRLLYEIHKISFDIDYDEVEKIFCKYAAVSKPSSGIKDLFQLLKNNNIKIGALSNSSFTGTTLKYELDEHDLSKYFDFIISSADYCLRKPNTILFDLAIVKMGLNLEDIWFIGDSYEYDMIGAIRSGLFPVWYNRKNKIIDKEAKFLEIKDMHEIMEVIKLLYEESA